MTDTLFSFDAAQLFKRREGVYVREMKVIWHKDDDHTWRETRVTWRCCEYGSAEAHSWLYYIAGLKMPALVRAYADELGRMMPMMEKAA